MHKIAGYSKAAVDSGADPAVLDGAFCGVLAADDNAKQKHFKLQMAEQGTQPLKAGTNEIFYQLKIKLLFFFWFRFFF